MHTYINKIIIWVVLLPVCGKGQLPNISFKSNNDWSPHNNIVFNYSADQIQINGGVANAVKTSFTTSIQNPPETFYLVAECMLKNVKYNVQNIQNPYMVIRNANGDVLYRLVFRDSLENKWFKSGIRIDGYNDTKITIEFGIQRTNGTFLVKNPLLSMSPPMFNYEFPFSVPTDVNASLRINSTETHKFNNDLLSANTHFVFAKKPWSDPDIQQAISAYFPMTNMRFPGGSVGNYYNYKTDNFHDTPETPSNLITANNKGFKLDFPGYLDFLKKRNATSTYMLNVMLSNTETAKNEYLDRHTNGLPLKWVELGNEMYLAENQKAPYVMDVNSYISHSKNISNAIKKINPSEKITVTVEKDDFEVGGWNDLLSKDQSYYDGTTLHNYISTNTYFHSLYSSYSALTGYKQSMDRLIKYEKLFPNKPMIISEWGIIDNISEPYFIQVMGLADIFLSMEKANENQKILQAGIHMLYKNDNNESSTLMYFDESQELQLTSVGSMYSKLFEVFQDAQVFDADCDSPLLEANLNSVYAKMVKKEKQYKIFAVNKLPVAVPFQLVFDNKQYTGKHKIETLSADLSTPVNGIAAKYNPWDVQSKEHTILLNPSSIHVITIEENDLFNIPSCPKVTNLEDGDTDVAIDKTILWTPAVNASGYRINLVDNNGTEIIDNRDVGNALQFTIPSLLFNNTYFLTISAYNDNFPWIICDTLRFSTISNKPACPIIQNLTDGDTNVPVDLTINWLAVDHASGYRINLVDNNGTEIIDNRDVGNTLQFTIPSLLFNNTYFLTISAYNDNFPSIICDTLRFSTISNKPACPIIQNLTDGDTNVPVDLTINWLAVDHTSGYRINLVDNNSTKIIDNQNINLALQYTLPNLAYNGVFCISVSPYDENLDSVICDTLCFSTEDISNVVGIMKDQTIVLPNPTNGIVKIQTPYLAPTLIRIYNAQNKMMVAYTSNENDTFDLSSYNPGFYFIEIRQRGISTWKKLLLVH